MAKTKMIHRSSAAVVVILVLAIVVVINFLTIKMSHYLRWDLTEDKRFTLSDSTKKILRNLEDRIRVNVYITEKHEKRLLSSKRRLEELLAEYQSHAPVGYFTYSFIDPLKTIDQDKYKEFLQELAGYGIQELYHRPREDAPPESYIFGLTIEYRDKTPEGLNTNDLYNHATLEYFLTQGIRRLVAPKTGSVAFLKGKHYLDVMNGQEYKPFVDYLRSEKIPILEATIKGLKVTPDDIDVLIIAGGARDMPQSDVYAIDQFVMKGGRLLVITEGLEISQMGRNQGMPRGMEFLQQRPSGLLNLLKHYGIEVRKSLVLDEQCYSERRQLPVVRRNPRGVPQLVGFREEWTYVPYFAIYGPQNYNNHSVLTQDLGGSIFFTSSPLKVTENKITGTKALPLVYSSPDTVLRNGMIIPINRMNQEDWNRARAEQKGPGKYLLAAAMTGKFTSFFKGKPVPAPPPPEGVAPPGIGGARGMRDAIDPGNRRRPTRRSPGPPRYPQPPPPQKKDQPKKADPKKGDPKQPAPPSGKEQPKKPEGEAKAQPAPKKTPTPEKPKPPETEKKPGPEKAPAPEKKPDAPGSGATGLEEIDIPGGATREPPETPKADPPAKAAPPAKATPPAKTAAKPPAEPAGQPGVVSGVPGGVRLPPARPSIGDNTAVVEKPKTVEMSEWNQIAVFGDEHFISGRFFHRAPPPGAPMPRSPLQGADYSWRLVRNAIGWMYEEEDIVRIRTRGMKARILKDDLSRGVKLLARILNIFLIPVLIIFAAFARWALKRRRRRRLLAMEVE